MAANSVAAIFQRLVGLETEYAIRFQSRNGSLPPLPRFHIYEALVGALRHQMPTAPARHFKEGLFLANGGAVWFETERPAAGGGLIEAATPECRGPGQTVAYQRAMDQLLSDAAAMTLLGGQLTLIKNDRDASGNVYGAQENYEATLAAGWRLFAWRIGLVMLLPLTVLTWLAILACVIVTLLYFAVAGLVFVVIRGLARSPEQLALRLFGRDLVEGKATCMHVPVWLETVLQLMTRVVTAPLALALYVLLSATAFYDVRRKLLPLLVTRPILAGAGMLDRQGRFHLSDKAPAINCVLGFGGLCFDRPVYTMGHFFKALYAESCFSIRHYTQLFHRRQRLQIGLGDSNMCEVAEYLRVGTTLLVLDAIESGFLTSVPSLSNPVKSLRSLCLDPSLRELLPLKRGGQATALEIQQYYARRCREFLESEESAPAEAWRTLELWEETLCDLAELAGDQAEPSSLIGRIDWITKRYLMEQGGIDADWEARKKIDIRYHELSPDGYYWLLRDAEQTHDMIADEDIERAQRTPPPSTPATMRGHYIREFAAGDTSLTANWQGIYLRSERGRRFIPLQRYENRPQSDSTSNSNNRSPL